MNNFKTEEEKRNLVRASYAGIAIKINGKTQETTCCSKKEDTACCSSQTNTLPKESIELQKDAEIISKKIGYSDEELQAVPSGANMGLGCGNPQIFAQIKAGETVVDLGSGAGFDAFLAARKVGETGRVIGVDMTPEMISKSRSLAFKNNYKQVEFRLGEIENLPIADNCVDCIISNCVINLTTRKKQVYKEAFRVLKNGGRIAISDVIAVKELAEDLKEDSKLICGCVAGAIDKNKIETILKEVGFSEIEIILNAVPKEYEEKWGHNLKVGEYVMSGMIKAKKII